jgi:hypothetical protein
MKFIFIAASLLASNTAFSTENTPWTDLGYRGEFVRSGGGFACKVGVEQNVRPEDVKRLSDQPCLFFGTLPKAAIAAIGMEAGPVLQAAGPASEMIPAAEGVAHHVYYLGSEQWPAVFIISVWKDRIGALQASGAAPLPGKIFNGIELGMPVEEVRKRFGEPFSVTNTGLPDTELWSYQPWTFSFEVSLGRVVSIRMDDPAFP